MKIALELNDTECQVLIDCLDEKIQAAEEFKETHEEYWDAMDDVVLRYKRELRSKIQDFNDLQEMLDKED